MGRKKRFTPEIAIEIARKYRDGSTFEQLGVAYGASTGTIWQVVKGQCIPTHPRKRVYVFSSEQEKGFLARYDAGEGTTSIAEEFSCPACVIAAAIRRQGGSIRPQFKLEEDTIQKAIRVYGQGVPLAEIALTTGFTRDALYKQVRKRGVEIRPVKKLSEMQEAEAIRLYLEGVSTPDIAKAMAVSKKCILRCLKNNAIERRTQLEASQEFRRRKPYSAKKQGMSLRRFYEKNPEKRAQLSASQLGIPLSEWQGFITPVREQERRTSQYRDWRFAVFSRDNFTCQMCGGEKSGRINAHHIKKFSVHRHLRHEMANGITLCKECHRLIQGKEEKHEAHFQFVISMKGPGIC